MTHQVAIPHPGLTTDLYHPDSAYVSWRTGRNGLTTFDLYTRTQPFDSAYLLVAGVEQALRFVQEFRYTDEELRFLSQIRDYDPAFLRQLGDLRFTGEILAVPEGSICFSNEPLMRVTAPFQEAILLESGLLQAISLATLIATKASRVVWAAQGRSVAEFALRRAQAPYTVTRSSFIGGCTSTSFLAAAYDYRLRATGTVPHALIQLYESEEEAFTVIAEAFNRYTLLLDTYDVRRAIATACQVAHRSQERLGHTLAAVRLDSGDIIGDSKYVRQALDEAGLTEVRILASGDLDEFKIEHLLASGAPIDAFGVGTSLGVGAGSVEQDIEGGSLGAVYKEAWYQDEAGVERAKIKVAGVKTTIPGRKEVYRIGQFTEDLIQLAGEPKPANSTRLLKPMMIDGEFQPGSLPPLSEIWEFAQANLRQLPGKYKQLVDPPTYPVRLSPALEALRRRAAEEYSGVHPGETRPPVPVDSEVGT